MIQVTVNIDEKMFDDSIGTALKEMKPEEIKEMITNCIKEYLLGKNSDGDNNIEILLYDIRKEYYGARSLQPSIFTKSMLEKLDYSGLQEVVDKCIEDLKNNHKDILEKVLLEIIVQGLTNTYTFRDTLEFSTRDIIRQMNNN